MKTEIVTMTPEWAEELLQSNTANRPVSIQRVAYYRDLIANGEWQLSHQGIAVGWNDVLIDGQHRLLAIAMAGRPVKILLSTECDPATFSCIDSGRRRSAADVLGIDGAPNRVAASSCVKACILYQQKPNNVWSGLEAQISNAVAHDWYLANRGAVDEAAAAAKKHYKRFNKITPAAYAAFYCLALIHGWACLPEKFLGELSGGIGLQENTAIYSFRRSLINGYSGIRKGRSAQQTLLASMIVVFNKWLRAEPVGLFRAPSLTPMPRFLPANETAD